MSEIVLHDSNSNVDYRLTFTRDSVRKLESMGFNLEEVGTKPMTMIPLLIRGAFLANHPSVSAKVVESLYDEMSGKESFMEALVEMYSNTLNSLLENNKKGKVKWERVG